MLIELGNTAINRITVGEYQLRVETHKKWVFGEGQKVKAQLFMLNDHLMLFEVQGDLEESLVSQIAFEIENIVSSASKPVSVVSRLHIPHLARNTRKRIFREEERLRRYIGQYYFVTSGRDKSLVGIYKSLTPIFSRKLKIMASEEEAILDYLHSKEKRSSDLELFVPLTPRAEEYPIKTIWNGVYLHVEHRKEWLYKDETFSFCGFLVNSKIFIHRSSGEIDDRRLHKINQMGLEIFSLADKGSAVVVSDMSKVKKISRKARDLFDKINRDAHHVRVVEFMVPNPLMKAILTVQNLVRPEQEDKLVICSSFEEALLKGVNRSNEQSVIQQGYSDKELAGFNADKLRGIVKKLQREKFESERMIKDRVEYLIHSIGNITWKQEYDKFRMELDEDDPFFDLFNTFFFLKREVADLIGEIDYLKQDLEEKAKKKAGLVLQKEANLSSLIEATSDLIFSLDNNYRLTTLNSSLKEFLKVNFGLELKLGDDFTSIYRTKELRDFWNENIQQSIKGERIRKTQKWRDISGKTIFLEMTFNPIWSIDGVSGISVFVKDITDFKGYEELLKKQNQSLIKVNQELDRFVYSTSHELRAPLSSLLGLIETYRAEPDHSLQSHYLDYMEVSIKKLDSFIQDIIDYSRNSRLGIQWESIALEPLLDDIYSNLQHYYSNIPDLKKELNGIEFIKADKIRLKLIVNNLLSNAVKYGLRNHENPEIKIVALSKEGFCEIQIMDNGPGIDPEHQGDIFKMFFRASTMGNGSGLGLFIAKEAADALQANLHLDGNYAGGARFIFQVPLMNT